MEYGEETLKRCLPIARQVVAGLARKYSYLDHENLEGEARMRLMEVLKGCDLSRLKEDAPLEAYVYTKLRYSMIDYIRTVLGRLGQKGKLYRATSLARQVRTKYTKDEGVELGEVVADQLTSREDAAGSEMASQDAVGRLLRALPKRHARLLLLYLEGDGLEGGPSGGEVTRQVMAELGVSESRVSMLRHQALGWLRDLGEAEVKRILLGVMP